MVRAHTPLSVSVCVCVTSTQVQGAGERLQSFCSAPTGAVTQAELLRWRYELR